MNESNKPQVQVRWQGKGWSGSRWFDTPEEADAWIKKQTIFDGEDKCDYTMVLPPQPTKEQTQP